MNKKIQLIFAIIAAFPTIMIPAEQTTESFAEGLKRRSAERKRARDAQVPDYDFPAYGNEPAGRWINVSRETANSMLKSSGKEGKMSSADNNWVYEKDFQDLQQGKLRKDFPMMSSDSKEFPMGKTEPREKWIQVPQDTYKDMQKAAENESVGIQLYGYNPATQKYDPNHFVGVREEDFNKYSEEKYKKGERIPWLGKPSLGSGPREEIAPFTITGTITEVPNQKMVEVPKSVVDEIAKKRAAENKTVNFEIDVNNQYRVPEEDYNKYYYNQLPWYQRWAKNISSLFIQKPSSSSGSGVLKSFASVPVTYTQPTSRFSRITVPKAFVPSPKTMERAKKLETPYIPTPSSKDSASKALKRADRFGGYQ